MKVLKEQRDKNDKSARFMLQLILPFLLICSKLNKLFFLKASTVLHTWVSGKIKQQKKVTACKKNNIFMKTKNTAKNVFCQIPVWSPEGRLPS